MDIELIDNNLNTIKAFHEFLSDIIDKGYNNDVDLLKLIVKHINLYVKDITEDNDEDNNNNDNNEDEDETTLLKNKIQSKIDKFMKNENHLSKIFLYKQDNKYIINMNQFIDKSYIY